MTEPRSYRILLSLQSALQGISAGSGYFFTVNAESVSVDPLDVIRIVTGQATPSPFFVIEAGQGGRPAYFPSEQMLELIPAFIIAAANGDQGDPFSKLRVHERLYADIERAILVDPYRGGDAGDTRVTSKQMNVVTGSQRVTTVVGLEIRTRRFYGSPNG